MPGLKTCVCACGCVCVTDEDCYRLGIVAMAECLIALLWIISHLWSSPTISLTLQSPFSEIAYDNEIKHLRVITDSQASSGTLGHVL